MTDTDDLYIFFLAAEQLTDSLRLCSYRAGRSFLDKQISVLAMFKGKENEVYRFFKRHDETSHGGLCDGDRIAILYLVNPKRNDRAARTHYIAIAGAADFCLARISLRLLW